MCEAPRKSEWALEHAKKLTPLPAPDAKSEGASVKQESRCPAPPPAPDAQSEGASVKQESKCPVKAEKPVKLEPKQDCQPDQQPEDQQRNEVDESMESIMDKAALIALRNLKSCRKTTHSKRFPVQCPHCNGAVFEGRNRAKVAQHTNGQEHRRRWKMHADGIKEEPVAPIDEAATGLFKGKVSGFEVAFGLLGKRPDLAQTCSRCGSSTRSMPT